MVKEDYIGINLDWVRNQLRDTSHGGFRREYPKLTKRVVKTLLQGKDLPADINLSEEKALQHPCPVLLFAFWTSHTLLINSTAVAIKLQTLRVLMLTESRERLSRNLLELHDQTGTSEVSSLMDWILLLYSQALQNTDGLCWPMQPISVWQFYQRQSSLPL